MIKIFEKVALVLVYSSQMNFAVHAGMLCADKRCVSSNDLQHGPGNVSLSQKTSKKKESNAIHGSRAECVLASVVHVCVRHLNFAVFLNV